MTEKYKAIWKDNIQHWYQHVNSSDKGLNQEEAEERFKLLHPGRPKKATWSKQFLPLVRQFKSPLIFLLLGAVLISAFLGQTTDAIIIFSILSASVFLSFLQERNAGRVVEKLQSLIALKSGVLRDGKVREITADLIVTGDVLVLNAGDMLPADCVIIESNALHTNESSLTGESFPVLKQAGVLPEDTPLAQRNNCLWQGTNIVSGQAKALVVSCGSETLFSSMTAKVSGYVETAFEKDIKDFGFFLMKIALGLSVFILLVNLILHKSIIDSALFALAVAVGMAPELLPAITTISMSMGAKKLLQKQVMVKKLNAIQNLGKVTLLCTDKTGTITQGNIEIAGTRDHNDKESEWVKQLAYWNASLESGYSNPIDSALKQMKGTAAPVKKLGEVPYDFIRKRISLGVRLRKQNMLITKGAFSQILEICTLLHLDGGSITRIDEYRDRLAEQYKRYGEKGFRVIAVCYKNIESTGIDRSMEENMVFAGFVLMNDPVKEGVIESLAELKNLNVHLKIITGDSRNVASTIARAIGMQNPKVTTGEELLQTSTEALARLAQHTDIFAEVEPQQKERIILALKQHQTVAYIGDGINDVSALHAADVGISVDNAVDAAREAADFVLLKKNLMVVADGIREGRRAFANTLKYLYISTGSTFGNMCGVAAASLWLPFLPMLPKQILLTNFLSDFPFLFVSTDNVDAGQTEKPGRWNMHTIRMYMVVFGAHSTVFDLFTFMGLYALLDASGPQFRTGWFLESVLTELLIVFIIRTHLNFFRSKPGKWLTIFSLSAMVICLLMPYTPMADEFGLVQLPAAWLGMLFVILVAYVVSADLLKVWFFRKYDKN